MRGTRTLGEIFKPRAEETVDSHTEDGEGGWADGGWLLSKAGRRNTTGDRVGTDRSGVVEKPLWANGKG